MLHKVLWILLLIFLIQMQETEQKSIFRRYKNGKTSLGRTYSKNSRPFLRRKPIILVEESQPALYTFNKPFGFMESSYQLEGRTNQAVHADEIFAEEDSPKKPHLIEDVTLKTDASFSSALKTELSIRQLLEEIVAKSRLLNADVKKEEDLTAMEIKNLKNIKKLNGDEKTEVKAGLMQEFVKNMGSVSKNVEKQTSEINDEDLAALEIKNLKTLNNDDKSKLKVGMMQEFENNMGSVSKNVENRTSVLNDEALAAMGIKNLKTLNNDDKSKLKAGLMQEFEKNVGSVSKNVENRTSEFKGEDLADLEIKSLKKLSNDDKSNLKVGLMKDLEKNMGSVSKNVENRTSELNDEDLAAMEIKNLKTLNNDDKSKLKVGLMQEFEKNMGSVSKNVENQTSELNDEDLTDLEIKSLKKLSNDDKSNLKVGLMKEFEKNMGSVSKNVENRTSELNDEDLAAMEIKNLKTLNNDDKSKLKVGLMQEFEKNMGSVSKNVENQTSELNDEDLNDLEIKSLKKLNNHDKSNVKVGLMKEFEKNMGSVSKNVQNQTTELNAESTILLKEIKTEAIKKTINKESTNMAKDTKNRTQEIEQNKKMLLEEMLKKAIMQHYWQHILNKAKHMEKGNQKDDETVNITKKKELSKLVKGGNKKGVGNMVEISATTEKTTLAEASAIRDTAEKFQIVANMDKNNENLKKTEVFNVTTKLNQNLVEVIPSKDDLELDALKTLENSEQNNNQTDIANNTPQKSNLIKNFPPQNQTSQITITAANRDTTTNQDGHHIDVDDSLTATIDDDELSHINQIYDIQDRSNAIVRILHKADLQTKELFKNSNEDSPFNLTSVTSESHPEEIVAMLLDDETLKNQLDFLQQNAPKIKKHKDVLSDKSDLLDKGVLTKNDTELEADFRKAVQEQLNKIGQNIKTVIDFNKLFANTSLTDSVEEVEAEPLQETNLHNEEETLELPQYIQFYGDIIDLPEGVEKPQYIDLKQESEFNPTAEVAHGVNKSTTEIPAEITLKFEKVISPSTPVMNSDDTTKEATEKAEEAIALPAEESLSVKGISNSPEVTDEHLTKATASIGKLTESSENKTEETTLLMRSNQTLKEISNDVPIEGTTILPTVQQMKEEDSKEKESTTIIRKDFLDKEKFEETTVYDQLKDTSPFDRVTEKLTDDYNSTIGDQETSSVIENYELESPTETETASKTTIENTSPEIKLLESFKAKYNSTVFEENSTMMAQSLQVEHVEETTFYHPLFGSETNTEKTIERPQKDNTEISITNMIKYDKTIEPSVFEDEKVTEMPNEKELEGTKLLEVLEPSVFDFKDTLSEEYFKKPYTDYANEFVETTTENFKENIESNANLSVIIKELAKARTDTAQVEAVTKEHQTEVDETTRQTELEAGLKESLEEVNELEKNVSTNDKILKEATEEEASNVKTKEIKTVKPQVEDNAQAEDESSEPDYKKLSAIECGEMEELTTVGTCKLKETNIDDVAQVTNENLEGKDVENASVEASEKLKETTTKESLAFGNNHGTVDKMEDATSVKNDNVREETIGNLPYRDEEKEDEMLEMSIVKNEQEKDETVNEMLAEYNGEIEDDYGEESGTGNDEETDGNTEEPIQVGDANMQDEILQERISEDDTIADTIEESTEESLIAANDKGKEEIMDESSAIDDDYIAEEEIKEGTPAEDKRPEMTVETSLESIDQIKEVLPSESLTVENDKTKEEETTQTAVKDNEEIKKDSLIYKVEATTEESDKIEAEISNKVMITDKEPVKIKIIQELSVEDNNDMKGERFEEFSTEGEGEAIDKIEDNTSVDNTSKENDGIKEQFKGETIKEILAEYNDGVKEENIKETSTVEKNGYIDLSNEKNILVTESNKLKGEKNDSLKYEVDASTEDSDKSKAEISDKVMITDKEPVKIQTIDEITVKGNDGIKGEEFEEFSTEGESEAIDKIRDNISVETKGNDSIEDDRNKVQMHKLNNKVEKEEQIRTKESTIKINKAAVIEKPFVRKKIKEETTEEITAKERITDNSVGILKNIDKIDTIEEAEEKDNDESIEKSKEELKTDAKVQVETEIKDLVEVDGNKMKAEIVRDTTTDDGNVKVKEMTEDSMVKDAEKLSVVNTDRIEDSTSKDDKKLNVVNADRKEDTMVKDEEKLSLGNADRTEDSMVKDDETFSIVNTDRKKATADVAEKVKSEITDLTSNNKTKGELIAISKNQIKAQGADNKWKVEKETTEVTVTLEQNKVKAVPKITNQNLKKQNKDKRRKNPVQNTRPVIKNVAQRIENNKIKNNTRIAVKNATQVVKDDVSKQKQEGILDESRPLKVNSAQLADVDQNKTATEILMDNISVKPVAANIDKIYVEKIETLKMDKEKLKQIEISIAKTNNTKINAEKANENAHELRIILSSANSADAVQKTGHNTLKNNGGFPEIIETTFTKTPDAENVKIDKGILKQIELNVEKKQNGKETQQNATNNGSNELRIIVTNKGNLDTNLNQHQDVKNDDDTKKPLVTTNTKTINQIKNQTKNGQFIRTPENTRHDENLTATKSHNESDKENIKKETQHQTNDKNNVIEIQKLNEDVSSTVNCVTTATEEAAAGAAEGAAAGPAVDSIEIDDADKNNQENSKRLEDIKTRAIKRIGIVMPEQQVEVENNKSIESELNDENNEDAAPATATAADAAAAVVDEDDVSDSLDVNDFSDDEMTTLKPVSLTWQEDDNSSMYHQSTKDEVTEDNADEEQQPLESDETGSFIHDNDNDADDDEEVDSTSENDLKSKDPQRENKIEDMKNISSTDKNQVLENNKNAVEQMKHDNLADSKNNDETNQQTDTFEDNKENVVTVAKIIDDNTMYIVKNHGNRKIPQKNQIPATADAAVVTATDDDDDVDVDVDADDTPANAVVDDVNYDVGDTIGFADTTQYHANKRIQNIEALEEQPSPLSNWWSTLHHAEIRKFLNSIFSDAADEFYQEIARQAREELKEIPQRHGVLKNHNRRKGSAAEWLSNVWSLW